MITEINNYRVNNIVDEFSMQFIFIVNCKYKFVFVVKFRSTVCNSLFTPSNVATLLIFPHLPYKIFSILNHVQQLCKWVTNVKFDTYEIRE